MRLDAISQPRQVHLAREPLTVSLTKGSPLVGTRFGYRYKLCFRLLNILLYRLGWSANALVDVVVDFTTGTTRIVRTPLGRHRLKRASNTKSAIEFFLPPAWAGWFDITQQTPLNFEIVTVGEEPALLAFRCPTTPRLEGETTNGV